MTKFTVQYVYSGIRSFFASYSSVDRFNSKLPDRIKNKLSSIRTSTQKWSESKRIWEISAEHRQKSPNTQIVNSFVEIYFYTHSHTRMYGVILYSFSGLTTFSPRKLHSHTNSKIPNNLSSTVFYTWDKLR